jgi:sirohydrochlorin ferrochelatase
LAELIALLVMVHGSPRPVANNDMYEVVDLIKTRGVFGAVKVGFMECNQPTIPEAIAACVAVGATRVIAVPYFLHVGTHVADDLPTLVEQARRDYPDVEFALGPYIGKSQYVSAILAVRAAVVNTQAV